MNLTKQLPTGISLHLCSAVVWACILLISQPCRADLVWEDHFTDEAVLGDGSSVVTPDGTTVTFGRTVQTGTHLQLSFPLIVNDIVPYDNADFFTFEDGMLGQHTGYLELAFDNYSDDPSDYIELALNFDRSVRNLQFSLTDIDSSNWDDGIEVYYNGNNNARDNPFIAAALGSGVGLDDESYMHGWEGIGTNADNAQTTGNIDFDFGSIDVSSIRIRYFSTDDASSDPGGQRAGLTDLRFTASTPEPSSIACVLLFAVALLVRNRRRPGTTIA
jgi:hypothetical protein